jgi:hypothetical protein
MKELCCVSSIFNVLKKISDGIVVAASSNSHGLHSATYLNQRTKSIAAACDPRSV